MDLKDKKSVANIWDVQMTAQRAQRADTVASLNSPVSSLDDPHQSDQEHY